MEENFTKVASADEIEPALQRQITTSQQLNKLNRVIYSVSFGLSFFDVISDILLIIEWFNNGEKTTLAILLLIAVFGSNIVTAMSLYTAMVELIEVILSIFGLGSPYHLIRHIIFFDNSSEKFRKSATLRVYHLLSLIEVQIESSMSILLQIMHITLFKDALSEIAIISLISSLISIGYNYSYHLYAIMDVKHFYFAPRQLFLKLVSALDVVSRTMAYAVCFGLVYGRAGDWQFIIAISLFVSFNATFGTFCVYKTLSGLPEDISTKIRIAPLFLGIGLVTSGGFMHSVLSSPNGRYQKSAIIFPSLEIVVRFIISMAACIIYRGIGDSFKTSGEQQGDDFKSGYDDVMFFVCMFGCILAMVNVIINNIIYWCCAR